MAICAQELDRQPVVKEMSFSYASIPFNCSDFQHAPLLLSSDYMEAFIFH